MKKVEIWRDMSPEGFYYEISHWDDIWNYYIILYDWQFTKERWKKIWLKSFLSKHSPIVYHKLGDSIFNNIDFHGGVIFYEKTLNVDYKIRSVKVGCDYNHLFDDEMKKFYTLESVKNDCLNTCKILANIAPPMVRCKWSGVIFDPKYDVGKEFHPDSWQGFLSPYGCGQRSQWMRENNIGR